MQNVYRMTTAKMSEYLKDLESSGAIAIGSCTQGVLITTSSFLTAEMVKKRLGKENIVGISTTPGSTDSAFRATMVASKMLLIGFALIIAITALSLCTDVFGTINTPQYACMGIMLGLYTATFVAQQRIRVQHAVNCVLASVFTGVASAYVCELKDFTTIAIDSKFGIHISLSRTHKTGTINVVDCQIHGISFIRTQSIANLLVQEIYK